MTEQAWGAVGMVLVCIALFAVWRSVYHAGKAIEYAEDAARHASDAVRHAKTAVSLLQKMKNTDIERCDRDGRPQAQEKADEEEGS